MTPKEEDALVAQLYERALDVYPSAIRDVQSGMAHAYIRTIIDFAPCLTRHPVVIANFIRSASTIGWVNTDQVQDLIDIQRSYDQSIMESGRERKK
jgi:hypothetical protein